MLLPSVFLERALVESSPELDYASVNPSRQRYITRILSILSLTFASISVLSTLVTLYWFVRMRRSFRHELIMLLVQSDFVKSAAFLIFPIVNLVAGPVESDSVFCQISGFSLAVGIESSDVAVLLIALHSVMYIFSPRSGLYPYRRVAYLTYYLFPVAIASLAFIDGAGYENVGHYCYLRADRGWRRMALSWIPRYVVAISIVVIYLFIYIYIRRRMYDYGRRSSGSPPPRKYHLPRISHHGLLPSAPHSRKGSGIDSIIYKQHHRSGSTISSLSGHHRATTMHHAHSQSLPVTHPIDWNWPGFRQPRSSIANPFPDDAHDPLAPNPPSFPNIATPSAAYHPDTHHTPATAEDGANNDDASSTASAQTVWRRSISLGRLSHLRNADRPRHHRANVSLPNIITMLRRGPSPHPSPTHPPRCTCHRSHPLGCPHHPTTFDTMPIIVSTFDSGVVRNRFKIRRQLRALFAYPLVYLIVWVFPFVSHIMGYDDAVRPGDPFWLLILGIISLCAQGTVDCGLFVAREKPWRYARRGLLEAIKVQFLGGWKEVTRGRRAAGRTREEMLVDGRLARERREKEILAERNLRASFPKNGDGHGGGREWWDGVDLTWFTDWEEMEERGGARRGEGG